jgi:hypothetical protein
MPMSKGAHTRSKGVQARITTVGRPLRLEIVLDEPWLRRLKAVVDNMETDGYPLQRYLEELIEADIVYREGISCRGPFLSRQDILNWLQRRHAGDARRPLVSASSRR